MFRIELLPWDEARAQACRIRFTVFVEEQKVPADMELDEQDALCVHALASAKEVFVGTARLLPDGHIGRMAVLKEWRGRGVGAQLLQSLMVKAKEMGHREVLLSAQTHAIAFYKAHGFTEEGAEYMDAGIPHRDMRRAL
jgi:predicted GNAT family N-acyltransferase